MRSLAGICGVGGAVGPECRLPCMVRFGVCDEVHQADAVFIGTVESVAPPFLDPFARAQAMASLAPGETTRLQSDTSPEALARLKQIYLGMFQGIPGFARAQIAEAKSQGELQAAFEAAQSEGRVAKFRVRTFFKQAGDDDKKTDDNDKGKDKPGVIDIWTASGECGFDFHAGETYLVYATQDEDSGKLETSICMRTRRLSDEKGDLAFLYFLQNDAKESTRLEGFVSTNFADQSLPRYENSVDAPSAGAILELDTGGGLRYTESDSEGRFAFDGLKAGNYKLSLLGPGFPRAPRTVVLSRSFHADEASCVRQILVLPTHSGAPELSQ